jgi:tricorn protease
MFKSHHARSALAAISGSLLLASIASGADVTMPRLPAASPDGSAVTFTWRGDLWRVSADGGTATRLTSHPADESSSVWSDDGTLIAFESTRDGGRNIYTIDPSGGGLRRVTNSDEVLALSGLSRAKDGSLQVEFAAALEDDLYRSPRPYFTPTAGGEPTRRHDAFGRNARQSPDGRRWLFERGGSDWSRRHYRGSDQVDVWLFDPSAKDANRFTQLTDHPGNDGWAQWRGDGTFLFLSDRDLATVNVFAQDVAKGAKPRRLTAFEGTDVKDLTVSRDGRRAFFTVWDTLYRLDLDRAGAQPVALKITAPDDTLDADETKSLATATTEIALNPDGKTVALIAFGDVWVKPVEGKYPARRVTSAMAREQQIAWSPDGERLYFTSDSDGGESIMAATVAGTRSDVIATARVLDPAPAPEAAPAPAATTAPASSDAPPTPAATTAPASSDAPPTPAATTAPASSDAPPAPDSTPAPDAAAPKPKEKRKPKEKPASERWVEAVRFDITPVVTSESQDRMPTPSPDGKQLAFRRGLGDIMVMDLATNAVRRVHEGWHPETEIVWSPDSRWITFLGTDRDYNTDIFIAPADGSAPAVNITRHPDVDSSPRWSADGRILAFTSTRINDESDVWLVFLDKSLEGLAKFEMEQYFKDAADAAKKRKPLQKETPKADTKSETKSDPKSDEGSDEKAEDKSDKKDSADDDAKDSSKLGLKSPPELSLGDAYKRLRRITTMPGGESNLQIAPAGDKLFFTGGDNEGGLFVINWDGTGQKRIGARCEVVGISLSGDKLVTIVGGKGQLQSTSGGGGGGAAGGSSSGTSGGDGDSSRGGGLEVDATIVVDRAALAQQKFAEAARLMGEYFYHPTMKGLDWDALTRRYAELAKNARTPAEFDHVANRLLGELNASHLGVRSPAGGGRSVLPQGRIGVRVRPVDGGLRIDEVLEQSPAALARTPLAVGDVIRAIDFQPVGASDTLEARMAGTIGRDVVVAVDRTMPDGKSVSFETVVLPVAQPRISRLAYEATQARNAKLVDEWSSGRIGYIHMQGMSQPALDEFERDLFAACDGRDGLIIDVRNNGGGWTADRLLASICAPVHAYTMPRGGDPTHTDGYPADRLFIQRFTGPINMLCNEKSFSNAEITAHAFKTLRRGTLVGMPTYGGVISTGAAALLDGTSVRMPTRGWYLPDGTDMELNGAVPDILVPQVPQDEEANNDRQLRAAVDNLMQRLPKRALPKQGT